jgi:3-hydroxyisobutyrate dehydrogenase
MNSISRDIGFIGLGLMGTPIALRLIEAGHRVTVWGRSPAKLEGAIAAGARLAGAPQDLAASSDIVFLCVTDTKAVESVVFGDRGVSAGARQGAILVDHSSIRPDATRDMADQLRIERGVAWIDAPVSGGIAGVASRTLVVMCGGDRASFEAVRPVMQAYAGRVTLMGPVGAGQTTKLVNQAICGVAFVALAEMTAFAERAGIDAAAIPAALAGGRGDSRLMQEFMPRMAQRDATRTGRIDIMLKDLDTVADVARQTGSATPMASLAAEIHRLLVAQGMGPDDPATLIRFFTDRLAGR